MFRVNWRPHPAELMRPGVNFGVPVGWGLRWCSDVYPRLRATAAGHPLGSALVFRRCFIPVRHGFFSFPAGLVCSAELASGVGEMIARFVHSGKFRVPDTAYSG